MCIRDRLDSLEWYSSLESLFHTCIDMLERVSLGGQFQYFTPDPNIAGDDKSHYWSSTAVSEMCIRDRYNQHR